MFVIIVNTISRPGPDHLEIARYEDLRQLLFISRSARKKNASAFASAKMKITASRTDESVLLAQFTRQVVVRIVSRMQIGDLCPVKKAHVRNVAYLSVRMSLNEQSSFGFAPFVKRFLIVIQSFLSETQRVVLCRPVD